MVSNYSTCGEIQEAFQRAGPKFNTPPLGHSPASPSDNGRIKDDTEKMNDITREELSITLSAIEDRMDRRIDRMEQSEDRRADAYRREQDARDKLYAERFEATSRRLEDRDKVIDSKLDAMTESVLRMTEKVDGFSGQLVTNVAEVKASNRNAILTILGIVVSVGAATVLGLWGANSTIVGSASSIFQAGQQQADQDKKIQQLLEETKAQSAETRALLEKMKSQSSIKK